MFMARRRIVLSDQIRRAVHNSGFSQYAIGKATDINKATLSRFVTGVRGLPMKTLDKLADFLNLNITVGTTRTAQPQGRKATSKRRSPDERRVRKTDRKGQ